MEHERTSLGITICPACFSMCCCLFTQWIICVTCLFLFVSCVFVCTTIGQRSSSRGNGRYKNIKSLIQILLSSLAPSVVPPKLPSCQTSNLLSHCRIFCLTAPLNVCLMHYLYFFLIWTMTDKSGRLLFKNQDCLLQFKHNSEVRLPLSHHRLIDFKRKGCIFFFYKILLNSQRSPSGFLYYYSFIEENKGNIKGLKSMFFCHQ